MEAEKKLYGGIDLIRLPCAILVVFLHSYSYDWGAAGAGIKYVLSSIGVPFFFIVSGFFFTKGLMKSAETPGSTPGQYLGKYLIRTVIMYTLWTVLTLPAAVYSTTMSHPEYSPIMVILRLGRSFFLSGSMGVFWYLLALIYNSLILYLMFRKKGIEIAVCILSLPLFLFGVLYENGMVADTLPGVALHVFFGSERNFLTVGLIYMCIGFLFARHPARLPHMAVLITAFVLSLGLKLAEMMFLPFSVFHLFTALSLFLIGLKWDLPLKKETAVFLRKYSSGLYFIHFPFIILFDFYLAHPTYVNFPATLAFASAVYFACRFLLPKKINGYLFG